MEKKFEYKFKDESSNESFSFEYDKSYSEKFLIKNENGIPVLYANRKALLFFAKTFAKMALSNYKEGFHLHLHQNLDADQPETFRILLNKD